MARYFRKCIHIGATDSPNVQLALRQLAMGLEPDGHEIIPGVLSWAEFQHRLATWDIVRRTIGLDGRFYEGSQLLLFPPAWLDQAESNWNLIKNSSRQATALGVDPAEGGDSSSWCVIDDLGVIELRSEKTPNTTDVTEITEEMMDKWNLSPERVIFDTGGGGKQHADRMRKDGRNVRAVGFGASVSLDPKRGLRMIEEKVDVREDAYTYVNRRAEMYHELSQLLDPALNKARERPGFALPPGTTSGSHRCHKHRGQCLRAQLAVIPKLTDKEGRYKLPPKNKQSDDSKEQTLTGIIGHSPDEADSVVLAVHALLHEKRRAFAGAF